MFENILNIISKWVVENCLIKLCDEKTVEWIKLCNKSQFCWPWIGISRHESIIIESLHFACMWKISNLLDLANQFCWCCIMTSDAWFMSHYVNKTFRIGLHFSRTQIALSVKAHTKQDVREYCVHLTNISIWKHVFMFHFQNDWCLVRDT